MHLKHDPELSAVREYDCLHVKQTLVFEDKQVAHRPAQTTQVSPDKDSGKLHDLHVVEEFSQFAQGEEHETQFPLLKKVPLLQVKQVPPEH